MTTPEIKPRWRHLLVATALTGLLSSTALAAGANAFYQRNLVSDIPGKGLSLDKNLVNPWGISSSATSPFWVSDQGTGKTTVYNTAGLPQALVVSMPAGSAPITGQVFSGVAGSFNGDNFLFASLTGTLTGWRGALGTTAEVLGSQANSAYTGLAIDRAASGGAYAFAADFRGAQIDVYKGNSGMADLAGNFTDPGVPDGYAPFNIQNLGGKLYVTYAKVGANGRDEAGAGLGVVSVFDLNGNFLTQLINGGALNAPWGVAIAPMGFGDFGGNLLVGNFGDGTINAFDINTGAYIDSLRLANGNPFQVDGLWGITFGNGGNGGVKDKLYFAAGIDEERHGLFGSLTRVPDTGSSALLLGAGLIGLIAVHRRITRKVAA